MNNLENLEKIDIASTYANRSILITGGSGFVGKVLIEKLLRDCRQVNCIYLLMRSKCGHDVQQRLDELKQSIVFERLRSECPEALNKLTAISGDITYPSLGINQTDFELLRENVSIVFHTAATIRFDEPLKRAINLNVTATKRVIDLCKQLKNLRCLLHVSTAYCTQEKHGIKEIVYPEPIPANKIIDAMDWMEDDILESLSPHLYAGRPTSYHYTKSLAETLLLEESEHLPIAIIRPSIISAAWREPFPGWTDNYNGTSGYLVVSGKGVLRTMLVHSEKICDIIPVDIVANVALLAAWYRVISSDQSVLQVYNCTSGRLNPITWREIQEISSPLLIKHPSMQLFRYPGAKFVSSRFFHELLLQIEHNIPAFLIDFLFKITGHKPILSQVYQKVHRSINALEYFTTNEWTYENEKLVKLLSQLNEQEKSIFPSDIRKVDWQAYFEAYVLGVRRFLLKEDPSTLPEARKRIKRLYYLTQVIKISIVCITVYQIFSKYNLIRRRFHFIK